MGADAKGSKMAWKPVKTAEMRHGGGHKDGGADAPTAPWRGSRPLRDRSCHNCGGNCHGGIKSRSKGLYKHFLEEALEYHRGARSLLSDRLVIGYLGAAWIAEASPIADPLWP
jgi:hypothetical protein